MQWAILGALLQTMASVLKAMGGAGVTSPLRIGLPSLIRAKKLSLLVASVDVSFAILVYVALPYIKLDSNISGFVQSNPMVGHMLLGFFACQVARLIPGMIPRDPPIKRRSNGDSGAEYLSRFLRPDWLKQIAAIVDVKAADRLTDWRNQCIHVWGLPSTEQGRLAELCNTGTWREPLPPTVAKQAKKLHGVANLESKTTELDTLFHSCLDACMWELLQSALRINLR